MLQRVVKKGKVKPKLFKKGQLFWNFLIQKKNSHQNQFFSVFSEFKKKKSQADFLKQLLRDRNKHDWFQP